MSTPTSPGMGGSVTQPKTIDQIRQDAQNSGNIAMAGPYAPVSLDIGTGTGKPIGDSLIYGANVGGATYGHGLGVETGNMTYAQARLLPATWAESNPDELKRLVNTGILNKAPGFQAGMGMGDILSAWDDLVQTAWNINQRSGGQKKWTPWDVLNTYGNPKGSYGTVRKGDWLYDAATGDKIKYVGPKSKTTTQTSVNLSSAEDVKALTTSVLTQALGRAPTAAEVAQYKATINAQENANPNVTTTTSTLDDQGETVAQSSKTTGGFSQAAAQQVVQDQAQKQPEYGKYQSGTTYWNALMSMLTGG